MPNIRDLHLGVLYLGGTIGCTGKPLAPLPAKQFLPLLETVMKDHLPRSSGIDTDAQFNDQSVVWSFFSGQIKDSSALIPEDWADLLALLLHPDHQHIQHWMILHGTDTLAFTAAFLETALQGSGLKVIVTGSQLPLLDPFDLTLNPNSDALGNLTIAYQTLKTAALTDLGWVRVAFNQQNWAADTVQKIHTQELIAFAGQKDAQGISASKAHLATHDLITDSDFQSLKEKLAATNIQIYYAAPLPTDILGEQLESVLTSGAEAVILMAYGLGNFPEDSRIQQILLNAAQRGVLVVITTQVPFGGVETRYAAGNWLAACGVLSAKMLPLPAIFAKLTWLLITEPNEVERRKQWLALTA